MRRALMLLGACVTGITLFSCSTLPPVRAILRAYPTAGQAPLTVEFDASASWAREGAIVAYHWDFDDGTTSDQRAVTHTFEEPGRYSVRLQVTAEDGQTDEMKTLIHASTKSMPVTHGADWHIQSYEGLASCEGPAPDPDGRHWYEPDYAAQGWRSLPLHDGIHLKGTDRDFFFRTLLTGVTAQKLRLMDFIIHILHNGSVGLWINGEPIPAAVFGRSIMGECHEDTGGTVTSAALINEFLIPDQTNTMALHLSKGPSTASRAYVLVIICVTSREAPAPPGSRTCRL